MVGKEKITNFVVSVAVHIELCALEKVTFGYDIVLRSQIPFSCQCLDLQSFLVLGSIMAFFLFILLSVFLLIC